MRYFDITQKAISHIKENDPLMGRFIEHVGPIKRPISENPFVALTESIVSQQLAAAAASTIYNRLINKAKTLTPKNILNLTETEMQECGLSRSKTQYIKNIAQAFYEKELTDEKLKKATNSEAIDMLTKIKGVGTWTAEMFLIFSLERQDIFSYKDLGLRRGIQWIYGLEKEPSKNFCDELSKKWSPYSSIVSLYLWEVTISKYFDKTANQVLYPYLKDAESEISYYKSPIGIIEIHTGKNGLEKLEFFDANLWENSGKLHEIDLFLSANCMKISTFTRHLFSQLDEYFDGSRKVFDIPLHLNGTEFQKDVWRALGNILYGETKSYIDIAQSIGNKKASRAVGGANNKNKIAIIVPCHRVIGKSGNLTGYVGGVDRKKWLLDHEAKHKQI